MRSPVFILAPHRSGSTLLRCILNTHSQIYAPHDTHLMRMRVVLDDAPVANSMQMHGFNDGVLSWMFRDYLLSVLLGRSGKRIFVDKSANLHHWRELAMIWPDALFLLLWRDSADIQRSLERTFGWEPERAAENTLRKMRLMSEARRGLNGRQTYNVIYDELTTKPADAIRDICSFLGVDYEPGMLNYKTDDLHPIELGVGDYGPKIVSGQIQAH